MTHEAVRPEVVQTIVDARLNPTAETLEQLAVLDSVTAAEMAAADNLTGATLMATADHRDRQTEVWDVLLKLQWEEAPPTWSQLFDQLSDEDVERLKGLYDAMPDGARAEFDGRYGRPEL